MAGIFGGDIFDGLGQATDAPDAAAPASADKSGISTKSSGQAFMPTGPASIPMPGADPYAYQPAQNNTMTYVVVGGLALAAIGTVIFLSSGRKVQANKRRRRRR